VKQNQQALASRIYLRGNSQDIADAGRPLRRSSLAPGRLPWLPDITQMLVRSVRE